jgi:hypothetical protein
LLVVCLHFSASGTSLLSLQLWCHFIRFLQHNGLVAATLLARQGLTVDVFEEKDIVGGACRTEYPFKKAPGLPQSTGKVLYSAIAGCLIALVAGCCSSCRLTGRSHVSFCRIVTKDESCKQHTIPTCPLHPLCNWCPAGAYLLGVMPPELLAVLGLELPLLRRDPHYFLPTPAGGSGKYLLLGSDREAARQQIVRFFSEVGSTGQGGSCLPSWVAPMLQVHHLF